MAKRVQSPSSIKVYKQCPRKYYYQYIRKLETLPNIHTVRGNVAHEVLEHFFDVDDNFLESSDVEQQLKLRTQNLLVEKWQEYQPEFAILNLSKDQVFLYFDETMMMLINWVENFIKKARALNQDFKTSFKKLTPLREQEFISLNHYVKGFIDAIEEIEGEIRVMDYKTSSSFDVSEHKLQLAIYSLLYQEKHNRMPDKAGVYYLKGGEVFIDVDEKLLEMAKKEIELIHQNTTSDKMDDYPKHITHLCKWSTGQCDFYDVCKNE